MEGQPEHEYANTFSVKVRLFSADYLNYARFLLSPQAPVEGHAHTKKLFSKFIGTSAVLEDFLDYHGAKNNAEWFYYRELSAAVRHLSLAAYSQKHILTRLEFYLLNDIPAFQEAGKEALNSFIDFLRRIAAVVIEEADRLGIRVPERKPFASDFPSTTTTAHDRLNHNIDKHHEGSRSQEEQSRQIVKIASSFLHIAQYFELYHFYEPIPREEIDRMVPDVINEVEIRRYEMLVHNLQSSFDTYVSHSGFNTVNIKLKKLRSHFSVVFHLLQLMGRLLHYYERHLYEAGKDIYQKVQNRLSELTDPGRLLDITINFGLFYVCRFLSDGKEVARELLQENVERSTVTLPVPHPRGFHSRPSLMVAKVVQHYGGPVELQVADCRFDASSVLDLQWAGGKIVNESITEVIFEGDIRSLKDLEILAGANYGEDAMGNNIPLPREIRYLRD